VILPENTKMPMGVNRHIFNKEIKDQFLTPGDTLTIEIQHRKFLITCRGWWKNSFTWDIFGYTVEDIE